MNAQKLFSKKWIVFATAVLCTLLWGSAFPGIKTGYRMFRIASQDTADQLMFAGARFLIAGILTLLISFFVEKAVAERTDCTCSICPDCFAVRFLLYWYGARDRSKRCNFEWEYSVFLCGDGMHFLS